MNSNFFMGLELLTEFSRFPRRPQPAMLEEFEEETRIANLCEYLSELQCVNFVVSGFGQAKWPVDVLTDLAVVLEQLPSVLPEIERENYHFTLEFYEQGLERYLYFSEAAPWVRIDCLSLTEWTPTPSTLYLEKVVIKDMLINLQNSFEELVNRLELNQVNSPGINPA